MCKNEGTCRPACDTPVGYTCDCGDGWEGLHCHLKVNTRFYILENNILMSHCLSQYVDVSINTTYIIYVDVTVNNNVDVKYYIYVDVFV